MSNLSTFTKVK